MKDDIFDDSYYDEDFNDDWDPERENLDDLSFDPDEINDNIDWMENMEDPDLLEDFDLDDLDDDEYNLDE
jgi:hypothetical protein